MSLSSLASGILSEQMEQQSRPIRKVALGPRDVEVERRAGGILHLRSPHRLGAFPDKMTERLEYWTKAAPERVLFAQREGSGVLEKRLRCGSVG